MTSLLLVAGLLGPLAQRPPLVPENPWIRMQGDITLMSAGYLTVRNPGTAPVVIRGVTCADIRMVTMHESVRQGEAVRMERRDSLVVPAGGRLRMEPGGMHLMVMGLMRPLNDGETLSCRLRTSAGDVPVLAPIRAQAP